jgi:hypothetical protein
MRRWKGLHRAWADQEERMPSEVFIALSGATAHTSSTGSEAAAPLGSLLRLHLDDSCVGGGSDIAHKESPDDKSKDL